MIFCNLHDLSASSTPNEESGEHENCKHSMRDEPGIAQMQRGPEKGMDNDQRKQPARDETRDGEQEKCLGSASGAFVPRVFLCTERKVSICLITEKGQGGR